MKKSRLIKCEERSDVLRGASLNAKKRQELNFTETIKSFPDKHKRKRISFSSEDESEYTRNSRR